MKAVFRFANFPILQIGFYRFVVSWTDSNEAKEGEAILDFEVVKTEDRRPGGTPPAGQGNGPKSNSPLTH